MKNIITLVIALHLVCTVYSQDTLFTYFSKQYRPDSINLITVTIEPTDIGYLIAGIAGNEEDMSFVKALDPLGNEIAELIIDDDEFEQWLTSGQQMTRGLADNEYWIAYRKDYSINGGGLSEGEVVVVKVDDMANLLLYQELENPYNEDVRAICRAHDGGLLITGWRQWQTGPTRIYVLKVDEAGNEVWNYEYVDEPNHRTEVGNISLTSDGGYIIGGAWSTNIGMVSWDWGYYIVKIDSEGIVEWITKAPIEEGQRHGLIEVFELESGGYLAHGLQEESEGELTGIFVNHLALLDENGNVLEERYYDFNIPNYSASYSGFTNNFISFNDYFLTSTRYLNTVAQAENRLWAIDYNLDTLWTKKIILHPDTSMYLYDMEPTPDGGVIMAGYTPFHTPQYGWALKIDSLGNTCSNLYHCDSVVIDTTTAVHLQQQWAEGAYSFELAPNPVSRQEGARLYYCLPKLVPHAWLRIYNSMGIEVKSQRLDTHSRRLICILAICSQGLMCIG